MKILLVGHRNFLGEHGEGPATALEALAAGARENTFNWTVHPHKHRSRLLQYLSLLLILLRRWDAINVHLAANYGLLVGLLYPRSERTFLTVHGYDKIEGENSRYNAFMHRLQIKFLFRNRIYVSHHIRQKVEETEHVFGGKVVPNAVDPRRLTYDQPVGTKSVDIFSLCGYGKTKGAQILVEAVHSSKERRSLLIAGHGDRRSITAMYPDYDKQTMLLKGPLRPVEIAEQFSRSCIYVQPSIYESFGMPVIEAFYRGIPVVVSRGAGVAEFLEDEKDALLVPAGDPTALEYAIERLLNDHNLRNRLVKNARETAKIFSPARIAFEYQRLFREVSS